MLPTYKKFHTLVACDAKSHWTFHIALQAGKQSHSNGGQERRREEQGQGT